MVKVILPNSAPAGQGSPKLINLSIDILIYEQPKNRILYWDTGVLLRTAKELALVNTLI